MSDLIHNPPAGTGYSFTVTGSGVRNHGHHQGASVSFPGGATVHGANGYFTIPNAYHPVEISDAQPNRRDDGTGSQPIPFSAWAFLQETGNTNSYRVIASKGSDLQWYLQYYTGGTVMRADIYGAGWTTSIATQGANFRSIFNYTSAEWGLFAITHDGSDNANGFKHYIFTESGEQIGGSFSAATYNGTASNTDPLRFCSLVSGLARPLYQEKIGPFGFASGVVHSEEFFRALFVQGVATLKAIA